jgi:hypothetical protein
MLTYRQLWKILRILEQEIPYLSNPLPLVEQVADIRLSWQRKDYLSFRIEVHNLMDSMRY